MDIKTIVNDHYQKTHKRAPDWFFETLLNSKTPEYTGRLGSIKSGKHYSKKACTYEICVEYVKRYELDRNSEVSEYIRSQFTDNPVDQRSQTTKNVLAWIGGQYKAVLEKFYLKDSIPMRYYLTMGLTHCTRDTVSNVLQEFVGDSKFSVKNGSGYKPLSLIGKQCITLYLSSTFMHKCHENLPSDSMSSEMMTYQRMCMSSDFIVECMKEYPFEHWVMYSEDIYIQNTSCWPEFFFAMIGAIYMALSHESVGDRAKCIDRILANHFGLVELNRQKIESSQENVSQKTTEIFTNDWNSNLQKTLGVNQVGIKPSLLNKNRK